MSSERMLIPPAFHQPHKLLDGYSASIKQIHIHLAVQIFVDFYKKKTLNASLTLMTSNFMIFVNTFVSPINSKTITELWLIQHRRSSFSGVYLDLSDEISNCLNY